jgi:hypothetical protein
MKVLTVRCWVLRVEMVLRCCGLAALRCCDVAVSRFCGVAALWRCGLAALRTFDARHGTSTHELGAPGLAGVPFLSTKHLSKPPYGPPTSVGWPAGYFRLLFSSLVLATVAFASADFSIRVEGEGYLRFLQDGRAVYAKSATLTVSNGELQEKSGAALLPPIRISASQATIDEAGWIVVGSSKIARIILAKFPSGLESSGSFLIARDRPQLGYAGSEGFGKILARDQGTEGSKEKVEKPSIPSALTPQRPNAFRIAVPSTATVANAKFTFGEIAEVSGPEADRIKSIDLGNSPMHGVPLIYTRDRILAKIALLGIDRKAIDLSMGNAIEIRRQGQVITPEQLLARARQAVEEKAGLKGELNTTDRLVEIHVPTGALELTAESVSLGNGTATVTVGVRVDGKRFLGRTIRLSGSMLQPAILAGASVTVRFVSNGLIVELAGRAKSGGAIGQTIEVSVTAEGVGTTTHQATIKSSGIVEVQF